MDVVWFAEIKWDYLRTRKQQIIRRRPKGVRVLFLEPYVRGKQNNSVLRDCDGVWVSTVPFVKTIPGGPLKRLLDAPPVRRLVDTRAGRLSAGLTRGAGIDPARAVAVISNVYAIGPASRLGAGRLVYDCNDAHAAFPGMPEWTRDYFRATCRRADSVVATSGALFDEAARIRGGAGGIHPVGNGVDYEVFKGSRAGGGHDGRVRVGYVGAIAPWFDFDAVEALARAHPDWLVELVGPVMLGVDEAVRSLERLENVTVRPAVDYDRVPEVMSHFTVGLIPFCYNELTRGVNPNKMYEYLAAGVPVVATRFSREVDGFPGLVAAADVGDSFVEACEAFVEMASQPGARARFLEQSDRVASVHDWGRVADLFWRIVAGTE